MIYGSPREKLSTLVYITNGTIISRFPTIIWFIWLGCLVAFDCAFGRCRFPFGFWTWFMNTRAKARAVLYCQAREWTHASGKVGGRSVRIVYAWCREFSSIGMVDEAVSRGKKRGRKILNNSILNQPSTFFVFLSSCRLVFPDGCELEKKIDLTCISEIAMLIK